MNKTFTAREIAQIKRTAQNVYPIVAKRDRILTKVKALYDDLSVLDAQIDAWEMGVKAMTGGYTTTQLVDRVVDPEANTTKFVLKYPDTITPPVEDICVECCTEGMPDVVLAKRPVDTTILNVPFDGCPMPTEECFGEPDGPCASVTVDNN